MTSFTLASLKMKYGIRPAMVSALVRGGLIAPIRGARREYRFSFHDVVLLRMAQDLQDAGISTRKLTRFLNELAGSLPAGSVAGMRVSAAGRELVVREDGRLRNPQGQLVLDLADREKSSVIPALPGLRQRAAPATAAAGQHFKLAESLFESDPLVAAEHYRQAVELDTSLLDAWINLTFVLLETGQVVEAYASCQEGLLHHPQSALLHFNFGLAQEEMGLPEAALQSYCEALRWQDSLADAHYNAGRMADILGRHTEAIRHFSAYRRMSGN